MNLKFLKGLAIGLAISLVLWAIILWGSIAVAHWIINLQHRNKQLTQQVQSQQYMLNASSERSQSLSQRLYSVSSMLSHLKARKARTRKIDTLEWKPRNWQTGWIATWYNIGGINGNGITATGHHVKAGDIAVDPSVIPLNSIVLIKYSNGLIEGPYHAVDTGGAIKGKHVDIWTNSLKKAYLNGVQHVQIDVLQRG